MCGTCIYSLFDCRRLVNDFMSPPENRDTSNVLKWAGDTLVKGRMLNLSLI